MDKIHKAGKDKMLIFQFKGKKYRGAAALDIIRALESDAEDYPHRGQSVRQFLLWSLERLGNRLPPRDLDLSDRLDDDALALSYLYLRDEYGAGKLLMDAKV
jgi:hypothetical protein